MINSGLFSNMVNGGDNGHSIRSTMLQVPTLELADSKSHLQIFRADSEELFKSWITSEESHSFSSSSMVHRTPQAMGRMSREAKYLTPVDDENSTDLDQNSFRNMIERGVHGNNPSLDKAWFHSPQPMTRSLSSELKRNYATLQKFQTSVAMETTHEISGLHIDNLKQEAESPNEFCEGSYNNILNHVATFLSSQHSSLSTFDEKRETEDGSFEVNGVQEVLGDTSLDQNGRNMYLYLSEGHTNNGYNRVLQAVNGSVGLIFDVFNGPMRNEVQTTTATCESSIVRNKESGNGNRAMNCMTTSDDLKPKERLVRCGLVTSADPVDEGEARKKRRVERSRKMAEAKERILTPTVSLEMQSIAKRCEDLEKEVRSLKLNLAFMNRKDSEQTKQLEELQIHHDELTNEKARMLEEIERILAARGKM